MAKVLTNNQNYTNIANAIRAKNGEEVRYFPSEMAAAIEELNNLPETTTITIDDSQYNYFEHITYTGVIDNEVTSIVLTQSDISNLYDGYYYFTINNILKNSTMVIVVGCDLDSYSGCEAVYTQSSESNDYGVIILSNIDNASITLVSTMDVMPDF